MQENEKKLKKARQHLGTFLISKLISSLGASIYSFGISFYILSATGSAMSFAVNLILNILPRTLLAPVAGYMADTYNKKAIIIISQLTSVLTMIGLLIFSFTEGLSIPAIYTASVLIAISSTFSGITFTASIANLVNPENIQKAASFNQISLSLATIGGPTFGGLLYGFVSLPVFIGIFIIAYLFATILESTMNFRLYTNQTADDDFSKEGVIASIKDGIRYLRRNELISRIVVVALVVNFLFAASQIGISYILIEMKKVDSTHFGLVEAAESFGMLAASIFVGTRAAFKSPIVVSKRSMIAMAGCMGLLALPVLFPLSYGTMIFYYGIVLLILGVMGIFTNTPISVIMQTVIDEKYKGRVFSLMETMAMALMPFSMLLFGFLYDFISPHYILITSCFVTIGFIILYIPSSFARKFATTEEAVAGQ
ncbi:MAG: MFS transporter [Bacillus sp. (in: firmicutes)]